MSHFSFRLAQGSDDFLQVAIMWTHRFGDFAQSRAARTRLANYIRNGSVVITTDQKTNEIVGCVVLDLMTHDRTLFVPFGLVAPDAHDPQKVLRNQLRLILDTLLCADVDRLLFNSDDTPAFRQAMQEFNEAIACDVKVEAKQLGTVEDYFSDSRTIAVSALFIQSHERPKVAAERGQIRNAIMRSSYSVAEKTLPSFMAASKCFKDKEDGEKGPDKDPKDKDSKEFDPSEDGVPLPEDSDLNINLVGLKAFGIADVYEQVGIDLAGPQRKAYSKPPV